MAILSFFLLSATWACHWTSLRCGVKMFTPCWAQLRVTHLEHCWLGDIFKDTGTTSGNISMQALSLWAVSLNLLLESFQLSLTTHRYYSQLFSKCNATLIPLRLLPSDICGALLLRFFLLSFNKNVLRQKFSHFVLSFNFNSKWNSAHHVEDTFKDNFIKDKLSGILLICFLGAEWLSKSHLSFITEKGLSEIVEQ